MSDCVGIIRLITKVECEDVPLVEFMYLVFIRMPGESYRRRLSSLLLYLYFCATSFER